MGLYTLAALYLAVGALSAAAALLDGGVRFGKRYEIAWLVAWILFWLPMLVVAVVYLLWRELRRLRAGR